jgi:acyl carrier protein
MTVLISRHLRRITIEAHKLEREKAREELIRFLGTIARTGQSVVSVGDDKDLIDAGIIDSLAIVQIILHLEQRHAVNLRNSGIDPRELASVSGILKAIGSVQE